MANNNISFKNNDKKQIEKKKRYVIKAFGRKENGESVYLKIKDFPPHFYVLLPETWYDNIEEKSNYLITRLKSINKELKYFLKSEPELVKRKKLYGFNASKKFYFLRFVFFNKSEKQLSNMKV